uniref:Mating type gene n=1 Tax=Diaporthe sp. 930811-14 TaxID=309389 RepID=Q1MX46_9PEZI|nr:mating type gene [Diaporthe sp. 930811-14]
MASLKPKVSIVRDPLGHNTLFLDESIGQDHFVSRVGPTYQRTVVNGGPCTIFFDSVVRSFLIAPAVLKPTFVADPGRWQHIVDLEEVLPETATDEVVGDESGQNGDKFEKDENEDDEGGDALITEEMDLDEEAPNGAGSSQSTEKIPRPPTSWQLFLKDKSREIREENPNMSFGEVSTEAARQWKAMSDEDKGIYQAMAQEAAEQHKIQYPNYRYQPGRK